MCVLILGGVFIDLWHAFDERRHVAQMVDAAAVAGANRIDLTYYKATGKVRLAGDAAPVAESFLRDQAAQAGKVVLADARLNPVGNSNEVRVTGTYKMDLMLAGLFLTETDLEFSVTGAARPLRANASGLIP